MQLRNFDFLMSAALSWFLAAGPGPAHAAVRTVVLVHGAFNDASVWNDVVPLLEAKGLKVVMVRKARSSLADGVAATRRAIAGQTGGVLLVGQSWGGAVINEAGNHPEVAGLVYVTSLSPDDPAAANDLAQALGGPCLADTEPESFGFTTFSGGRSIEDADARLAAMIAAAQASKSRGCADSPARRAAWRRKPSWYVDGGSDRRPTRDSTDAASLTTERRESAGRAGERITNTAEVVAVIVRAAESADHRPSPAITP